MIETKHLHAFEVVPHPRRKRMAIQVSEGKVQVLTPLHFSETSVKTFLDKHARWVQKKLNEQIAVPPYHPKQYLDGEIFTYLGENYFLNVAYAKQPAVMLRDNQLFVFIRKTTCPQKRKNQIHRHLYTWYCQQAEQHLNEKSHQYAQTLSVQYRSISIRQFKSRWGSCSVKGDIQYTWQIILAPQPIINYLVVHELAHIKHHNHSPKFWRLVETIIPDYKSCKDWLKKYGHQLRIA